MIPEKGNLKNDDNEICWKGNGAYEASQSLRRSHGTQNLWKDLLKGTQKNEAGWTDVANGGKSFFFFFMRRR